jgi:hypothetical protein
MGCGEIEGTGRDLHGGCGGWSARVKMTVRGVGICNAGL